MTAGALAGGAATVFLGLVFLKALAHKLADLDLFTGYVAEYGLLPEAAVGAAARALVAVEAFVVVGLFVPAVHPLAAGAAIGLLLFYAAAMALAIGRGLHGIDCGCGGPVQPVSWALVGRNVAIVLLGLPALALDGGLGSGGIAAGAAVGLVFWAGLAVFEQIIAVAHKMPAAVGAGGDESWSL